MTPTAREKIAAALRQRRAALLSQVADTEADLAAMAAERESELEERAQEDRLARLLARLDDRERREIDDIHAALQRLIDGTYERCEDCEEPIDPGRLSALPTTRSASSIQPDATAGDSPQVVGGRGRVTGWRALVP